MSPFIIIIIIIIKLMWTFCSTAGAQELTACQKAAEAAGGESAPPGAYVPQCDKAGQYIPLQFHASSGHSWCVRRDGTEIPGTRTPPGNKPVPDCAVFITGT